MKFSFWLIALLTLAILGCATTETGDDMNNEAQVPEWGNLTCPVMRSVAVNKNYFTIFEGKKVYFSSPGCLQEFLKNPEEYRDELMAASGK